MDDEKQVAEVLCDAVRQAVDAAVKDDFTLYDKTYVTTAHGGTNGVAVQLRLRHYSNRLLRHLWVDVKRLVVEVPVPTDSFGLLSKPRGFSLADPDGLKNAIALLLRQTRADLHRLRLNKSKRKLEKKRRKSL